VTHRSTANCPDPLRVAGRPPGCAATLDALTAAEWTALAQIVGGNVREALIEDK
jgi:hypothetical protein